MNCKSFQALTPRETADLFGKLIIAVQYNEGLFRIAKDIVEVAEREGIYDKAILNPEVILSEIERLDINNPIEQ